MKDSLPLVLFDSECPLCVRFKQGLEYLDPTLHFVSAREESVYKFYPELNQEHCLDKVHLITLEREVLVGQEVVDYLVKRLPGVSKLSWLLETERGEKVKSYFYQKVEELRELSKKDKNDCRTCPRE